MNLMTILGFAFLLGWCGLQLWAALLARRGRKTWATRMMFIGAILQSVGGCVYLSLLFAFAMGSAGAPPLIVIFSIGPLAVFGGMLVFLIGLIGLCARYGALEKRSAELETLTQQFSARLPE